MISFDDRQQLAVLTGLRAEDISTNFYRSEPVPIRGLDWGGSIFYIKVRGELHALPASTLLDPGHFADAIGCRVPALPRRWEMLVGRLMRECPIVTCRGRGADV